MPNKGISNALSGTETEGINSRGGLNESRLEEQRIFSSGKWDSSRGDG